MEKTTKKKKPVIIAVSGGFDPIHVGHVRMFHEAKLLGDELVVILNNDNWLINKKGFFFMSEEERKEVIEGFRDVDRVILTKHRLHPRDMSVCAELKSLRPNIFANGGDRNKKDAGNKLSSLSSEQTLCQKLGIKMVFNVGKGGKIQSSSWLIKNILDRRKTY